MTTTINLSGQTALVTGGSRGIGRQIALSLGQVGARVAVAARDTEKLTETVRLLESQGTESLAVSMDVADAEQVTAGVEAVRAKWGAIDLLVNNAGIVGDSILPWDADPNRWWQTVEVNLKGAFLCAHAVLPGMVERQRGRIINLASKAGLFPNTMTSAYSVSKTAMIRLTECLALSAKEANVQVFAISPGLVRTDMTRDLTVFKELTATEWTPIERSGELCVLLASGQADALTGRYIHVSNDDVHDLIRRADELQAEELNVLRMNR
jgi:NAD(P)-dependent dehydrogenase (short-subunit alcohol dehydrogenase family)